MSNENYEIENEEEIEEIEEAETESSGNGFVKLLIGAAIGVGGCAAYKYVVKPIRNKIKTKKEEKIMAAQATVIETESSDVKESVDEENS